MTYEKNQIVKYANPQAGEEELRFVVIEDRETTLLVGLVGAKGFGETEAFAKSNYELAND